MSAPEQADFRARARPWPRGNQFKDFSIGRTFAHHWGRTITAGDNALFSTLTLHYNPLYFNESYAVAHGHPRMLVNPLLVFNTVFGLSVEDLSEGGGPFVGVDELTYHQPVYVGDTLSACSEVVAARESRSRPEFGIVTWHTKGFNQCEQMVIDYKRSNLVRNAK